MRVVLPYKNALWKEVDRIAQQWIKEEPKTTEAFTMRALQMRNLAS